MGTGLTPLRSQMTRSIAALLALWGQTTRNPLDLLKTQLQTVQTQRESVSDESRLFFLGIVAAAVLVLRLDGAVLRNEIDGMRFMIISVSASLISRHDGRILTFLYGWDAQGINSSNIATRQAASVLIVALQANIRNQDALFDMLVGLTSENKDLAAYMIKRDLPNLHGNNVIVSEEKEGGLSKSFRRLSTMRL